MSDIRVIHIDREYEPPVYIPARKKPKTPARGLIARRKYYQKRWRESRPYQCQAIKKIDGQRCTLLTASKFCGKHSK